MRPQYDSIASHYSGARNDPVTLFLEMPSVTSVLGDISGKSVIDFACGTGHYSRFFAELGAAAVLGLEGVMYFSV